MNLCKHMLEGAILGWLIVMTMEGILSRRALEKRLKALEDAVKKEETK
jgi:hypothetical protein